MKKKVLRDIINLHMCTINDNHMMYGSWDMEHDRQNFLSFWTVFCPIVPLTTRKIKILKKWKKGLQIPSFYTWVPKIMIICLTVPEIQHVPYVIFFFSFWAIFCPSSNPKQTQSKQTCTYHDFTHAHKKIMILWCKVPEYGAQRRDRRTDGRADGKSDI